MKRFIITVLFVSVFLIGIGSIIEKTSAKFSSDEKAMQLIRQARIAIGGDTNLKEIQSMSIIGTTTNFFEKNGVQDVKQGSLEINFEMPNRFSKMVKIGNPGDAADEAEVHKEVNVVVMNKDGQDVQITTDGSGNKENVFVFKKGEGDDVEWRSETDGDIKADGNKVVIKKDDGTVEEITNDGKKRIIIRKDANGNVLTEDVVGPDTIIIKGSDGKVITEDVYGPKRIVVEKEFDSAGGGIRQNEMLRLTIALLMTAPQGTDVSYKFVGVNNVDGNPANLIAVESNGTSFKLYLDSATNLPRMISYQAQPHRVMFFSKDKMENLPKEKIAVMKKDMADQAPVEHQIRFSDFRTVGNLIIPHRWSESAGGKQIQSTDITSYELNPANIADKFGREKVFVRKMKPQENN